MSAAHFNERVTISIAYRRSAGGYPVGHATLHSVVIPRVWGIPPAGARIELSTSVADVRVRGVVVGHLYSDAGVMLFVEEHG